MLGMENVIKISMRGKEVKFYFLLSCATNWIASKFLLLLYSTHRHTLGLCCTHLQMASWAKIHISCFNVFVISLKSWKGSPISHPLGQLSASPWPFLHFWPQVLGPFWPKSLIWAFNSYNITGAQNHRMTKVLRLVGSPTVCLVQSSCSKQHQLGQVAQSHVQLIFEYLHG